jgi:putative peptide zinc metalloprotease protein
MVFCGLAMIVWINTRTGEWIHDFAYQIILFSGLTIAVINLNPLLKIDGYYFFTEVIEIPDLKERSTAFLSGWFQKRFLRLPVEVPIVPRRRAPFFILYAFLSGLYCYLLLFIAIRFCYNVASHWMAEFALIPAGIAAFFIFRSRLRSLRRVAKEFWQHNFASERGWGPVHTVAIVAIGVALFVPLWRDRVSAYYVIEPVHSHTVHASIAGRVDEVLVQEGETVRAGQPLLRMSSLDAASMRSSATSHVTSARFQAFNSQLQGQTIGSAAADQNGAARLAGLANEAHTSLLVVAPADGTVLTENPGLLRDQDVASGQALLNFAESGPRIARIFIPASALDRVHSGAEVALAIPGEFSFVRLRLSPLAGDPVSLPPGLVSRSEFEGIQQPVYYDSRIVLPQLHSSLALGTSGEAKIFGARRSLAERAGRGVLNLVKAHVW